jgi:hypothetical protein
MSTTDTIQPYIEYMESILRADPAAMHSLVNNRIPCNSQLADHPTSPVETIPTKDGDTYAVSTFGIVNGLCRKLTGKSIAVQLSDPPVNDQRTIVGFSEYK